MYGTIDGPKKNMPFFFFLFFFFFGEQSPGTVRKPEVVSRKL